MKNTNKIQNGGFAPLGAIVAGLVALGILGAGALYQYTNNNSYKYSNKNQTEKMFEMGVGNMQGQRVGHEPNMNEEEFAQKHNKQINAYPYQDITTEEKEDLLFMREEEKLARDVYITLYEKWGDKIFNNISKSESRHMIAVKSILDKYQIEDPVLSDEIGVFQNQDLQNLYNDLVAKGMNSLQDALEVGTTIEDVDIRDLHTAIAHTNNEDIKFVYENLMRGSRNHMRSFYSALQNMGIEYKAQYISQEELEDIVNTEKERGNHGNEAGEMQQHGHGQDQGQMMHAQDSQYMQNTQGQGMHGRGQGQGRGQGRGKAW